MENGKYMREVSGATIVEKHRPLGRRKRRNIHERRNTWGEKRAEREGGGLRLSGGGKYGTNICFFAECIQTNWAEGRDLSVTATS
jgi:hypothetical protein